MPRGLDLPGSFRSPDIPTPESIPVTAGKNTAKTGQKSTAGGTDAASGAASADGAPPQKSETSDATIAAITKYWLLSARSAETDDTSARNVSVPSATCCGLSPETTGSPDPTSASEKPDT